MSAKRALGDFYRECDASQRISLQDLPQLEEPLAQDTEEMHALAYDELERERQRERAKFKHAKPLCDCAPIPEEQFEEDEESRRRENMFRLAERWRSLTPLSRKKELLRRHMDELRKLPGITPK